MTKNQFYDSWTFLLEIGHTLLRPGGLLRCRTFHAKTGTVPGKLGKVDHCVDIKDREWKRRVFEKRFFRREILSHCFSIHSFQGGRVEICTAFFSSLEWREPQWDYSKSFTFMSWILRHPEPEILLPSRRSSVWERPSCESCEEWAQVAVPGKQVHSLLEEVEFSL